MARVEPPKEGNTEGKEVKQRHKLSLDFNQQFYIPIHNYFNTLTIEIVNQLSKGWIRKYKQEFVLAKFDIRLPDIRINPETGETNFDGNINLPIDKLIDYKKLGMKQIQHDVKLSKKD
jgi:hypothetical protein